MKFYLFILLFSSSLLFGSNAPEQFPSGTPAEKIFRALGTPDRIYFDHEHILRSCLYGRLVMSFENETLTTTQYLP